MNQWIHVKPVLHNINIDKKENDLRCHRKSRSQNVPKIENGEKKKLNYTSMPNKTTTHEDADIPAQIQAYNRRAKFHLQYINHPGKIAQLGLTTRPVVLKMDCSTDVSSSQSRKFLQCCFHEFLQSVSHLFHTQQLKHRRKF